MKLKGMLSRSSLILVGHGSTVNPDSSAPTLAHANTIRKMGCFREVVCAFWKEEPGMREALNSVRGDDIYIVPNFISEGYFTQKIIPREFELTGPITRRAGRTLKYCEPVGNHPRITELLLRRAKEAAPGVNTKETSLIVVGHGTRQNDNSSFAAIREAQRIRESGLYAETLSAYIEQPPFIGDWDRLTSQPSVVVVPFFIADGMHSFQDIPALLGMEPAGLGVFSSNPHRLRGRDLYYARSIGTEPLFAELLLAQTRLFDLQHPRPIGLK